MNHWKHLCLAVASAGLLAACGGGGSESPPADAAQAEPSTSEFMKLATAAGTTERLRTDDQITLIAPSNEAMAEVRDEIEELKQPENREQPKSFVESHLVPKRMGSDDMQTGTEIAVPGSAIEVDAGPGSDTITINGANIAKADVKARNGVMFVTHRPLFRPGAYWYLKHRSNFSILDQAIRAAGLTDALRTKEPFTLFAPTDDAFAALLAELNVTADQLLANKALLTEVLTHHLLPQKLWSRKIADGATPATVQGQAATFDVQRRAGPDLRVTDAQG